MEYASREEILGFLNELLEAERAGAQVTAQTALQAISPATRALLTGIYRDEARWCAMLLKWISQLDGEASPKVGAFYEKCMAIDDLPSRLAFLNRGQGWVARKLREMLPRVPGGEMHRDFNAMLDNHIDNIAAANDLSK